MKYLILVSALLSASSSVWAAEDNWTGSDKALHFAVSSAVGLAAYSYTKDKPKSFAIAMAPGLLKEVIDSRQEGNHFSGKDLVWDAVGAYVGIQVGHWSMSSKGVAWSTNSL